MAQQARRTRPPLGGGKKPDPGYRIVFKSGGSGTYNVRMSQLTPQLVRELRRQTGFGGWVGLNAALSDGVDIDVLAALVWLARRIKGEDNLTYDTVLDSWSYDIEIDFSVLDGNKVVAGTGAQSEADDDEGGDLPEA